MTNFWKLGVVTLFLAFLMSSCEKTNVDDIIVDFTPDTVNFNPLLKKMNLFSSDTLYISCVAIPYPIKLKQTSGNQLLVSDSADLSAAIQNPDSIIDFVYPLKIYLRGTSKTVLNIQELLMEVAMCDTGTVTCADLDAHMLLFYNALNIFTINRYPFTINYPVQMEVNGLVVTLNQDSDYLPAIGGNPMRPDSATLVYPITIQQFGQTIVLNSDQDVCDFHATLDENCSNKPGHIQFFFNGGSGTPSTCAYFINFPVQGVYNGTILTFQNYTDYTTLLMNDPNVLNGLSLIFPVSIEKYSNGQNLSFNSNADICQYLNTCN